MLPALDAGDHRFESCHPDHFFVKYLSIKFNNEITKDNLRRFHSIYGKTTTKENFEEFVNNYKENKI